MKKEKAEVETKAKELEKKEVPTPEEKKELIGKKSQSFVEMKVLSDPNAEGPIKVVITKQVVDRDGEVLSVAGCNLDNYRKNPIVLWGHRMNSGDVEDIMGRLVDIEKTTDADGIPMITGIVEFADHPKAQYCRRMVKQGILKTLSVGFMINDYDYENSTVTIWELLETSFVNVPANTEAQVREKSLKEADEKLSEELYKKLGKYEDLRVRAKAYRDTFLSKDFVNMIHYEKTGSELEDIKNVFEIVKDLAEEKETPTPEETKDAPFVTRKEVLEAFSEMVSKI
mgnify:CR=1 FL=1